jgi:hypothetical protein
MATTRIAMMMTLAACEHAEHVEPVAPPQLASPAPTDAAPAPAIAVPADAAPTVVEKKPLFDEDKLDQHCMSRAGCKWKGEKAGTRVTKKPTP